MSYLRNIKDMLNIPAGNRNVASNGYSTLTDSQVFFGSQFCHEHSQGMSQDVSLSSRNSQQSSQEGSDPTILNRYTSKPLLFGDKMRTTGLLEKFEEDRKKAKEKHDSEQFIKESQHIREALINIQQLVAEKNTSACQTISEKCDNFASSLKTSLERFQRDISLMFETLVVKLISQKEVMAELEEKLKKNGETTAELATQLKSLKSVLECLREEQEREQKTLEETLNLFNSLVPKSSDKSNPKVAIDSSIQTSPDQKQSGHKLLQSSQTEGTQLDKHQSEPNLQVYRHVLGKKRLSLKGQRRKNRPLVPSQRRKQSVQDENNEPMIPGTKPQIISATLKEHRDQNALTDQQNLSSGGVTPVKRGCRTDVSTGCFINPLSCWSQDSNSPECLAAIGPILERFSAESKMATPVKDGDLWELFDSDFDF